MPRSSRDQEMGRNASSNLPDFSGPPNQDEDRIRVDKRFCMIFLVSSLFLLLLGAGGYALYEVLHNTDKDHDNRMSHSVCTLPSCIETSSRVLSKMDLEQNPCSDSYTAYCGTWQANTEIPSDMSLVDTSFTKINHDIREEVKTIVESWGCKSPKDIAPYDEIQGWRLLAGCMYQSCLDEVTLDKAGSIPLLDHIRTHLPFLLDSDLADAKTPFDNDASKLPTLVAKVLAHLNGNNVASFIIAYSQQHPTDAERPGSIPHLVATGLGLGYDIYVASDVAAQSMRKKYVNHIANLFELYDYARRTEDKVSPRSDDQKSRSTFLSRAVDVLALETRLRDIQLSPAEARDPILTTHVMKFKEAVDLMKDSVDLRAYFEESMHMGIIQKSLHDIYFHDESDFVLDQPDFFKKLKSALFPSQSGEDNDENKMMKLKEEWGVMMDYFLLRSIRSVLSVLGGDWLLEKRHYTQTVSGTDQVPPRWKECLSTVRNSLGWIAGEAFITSRGTEEAKQRRQLAEQIVADVRTAFRIDVQKLHWMDEETKQQALLKEEKIVARLGFPEWLIANPESRLLKMYGPALAARDFLLSTAETSSRTKELYEALSLADVNLIVENAWAMLDENGNEWNMKNFFLKLNVYLELSTMKFAWSDLGTTTDPHIWALTPDQVNAYYAPSLNEMVFPASIFRPPFMELPDEKDPVLARLGKLVLSYGALGAVAGHELTHAFDDAGSTMDADGVLRNWWTEKSRKNFMEAAQCLVRQYSAFPVEGLPDSIRVNGLLTLGENIADAGGIKLAMHALKIALEREPKSVQDLLARNVKETEFKVTEGSESGFQLNEFFASAVEKKGTPELLPGLLMSPYQLAVTAFSQIWCSKSKLQVLRSQVATDPHAPGTARVIGSVRNLPQYRDMFNCPDDSSLAPEPLGGKINEGELQCDVW